jgi:arsenite methyltransferase
MNKKIISLLVDPVKLLPLDLEATIACGEDILVGQLKAVDGTCYLIENRIPRLLTGMDPGQRQTSQAFGYKWSQRGTYDSPAFKEISTRWMIEKYGFQSLEEWSVYFSNRSCILDLGCGSGYSSSLWLSSRYWTGKASYIGVDISSAVDVASDRLHDVPNVSFVQADALALPFTDGCFDTVFSEGVLHHTPSTREALLSGARVLAKGGEYHFYVYRHKGPVREFTDDYIRQQISDLSDEDAWEAMRSLTYLGKVLSENEVQIEIDKNIPLLGINSGTYKIQRLIYWNFAKLYWNSELTFEENVHVNFDWYRPYYAHRQTENEVRQWCEEAQLSIKWWHAQESGFSIRAVRK